MPKKYFYGHSKQTAISNGQMEYYGENFQSNMDFKAYFDGQTYGLEAKGYDGSRVDKSYAQKLVDEWGFDRTLHMLANTIWHNRHDGRYSQDNKDWAAKMFAGISMDDTNYYTLSTHPGLIDIMARQVRGLYQAPNLYGAEQCQENRHVDFENQVVVLKAEILREDVRTPANQLWLATSGFGCSPTSSGRRVYVTSLADGEKTSFYRQDFVGIIKDELLPDWARDSLEKIREQRSGSAPEEVSLHKPDEAPESNGIEMNM